MSGIALSANMRGWLTEPLPTDVKQSLARLAQADDVQHIAVMPDVHLSGDVCVGVALATTRLIYPAAVGGDIGCGMAALAFDAEADILAHERSAALVLRGLYQKIPSLKHSRETAAAELPSCLQTVPLSDVSLEKLARRDGRVQLGTLGRGNHFLEFQADGQNRLWVMLHSGSRGMGQAITSHHVRRAAENVSECGLIALDASSPQGKAYRTDVDWAILYAEENRRAMLTAVTSLMASLFGIQPIAETLIHANHNHVRQEEHLGQRLWVHRKGALPAADGEAGIIPGSMGTSSFHVTGRGCADALCSSSHGAGRELSRAEACRKISPRQVQRELEGVWFDHCHVSQLRDEAPSAYKDIHTVMRAQRELTRIDRQLRPVLCYKGT
jgi:tRNA-splicing ligase RtcB